MKRKIWTILVMSGLMVVLAVSGFKLVDRYFDGKKSENSFKEYQQIFEEIIILQDVSSPEETNQNGKVEISNPLNYEKLIEVNEDFVGWITISGTPINYPVLQSKENPDYYLNHGLDQRKNGHGVPYVDYRTNLGTSTNTIIYGHQMKDGTMFAGLNNFLEESFYQANPRIIFNSIESTGEYEIISVFKTSNLMDVGFDYYNFIDATSEKDFDEFIRKVEDLAIFDTLTTAKYGDQLLTLSTCEYTLEEGRLVVVAKKSSETIIKE